MPRYHAGCDRSCTHAACVQPRVDAVRGPRVRLRVGACFVTATTAHPFPSARRAHMRTSTNTYRYRYNTQGSAAPRHRARECGECGDVGGGHQHRVAPPLASLGGTGTVTLETDHAARQAAVHAAVCVTRMGVGLVHGRCRRCALARPPHPAAYRATPPQVLHGAGTSLPLLLWAFGCGCITYRCSCAIPAALRCDGGGGGCGSTGIPCCTCSQHQAAGHSIITVAPPLQVWRFRVMRDTRSGGWMLQLTL